MIDIDMSKKIFFLFGRCSHYLIIESFVSGLYDQSLYSNGSHSSLPAEFHSRMQFFGHHHPGVVGGGVAGGAGVHGHLDQAAAAAQYMASAGAGYDAMYKGEFQIMLKNYRSSKNI